MTPRFRGWLPIVFLPLVVVLLETPAWPRWAFMWALAISIYAGCKWLTWRRAQVEGTPLWRRVGYLLAWPGLDARSFLGEHPSAWSSRPAPREWWLGVLKTATGLGLLFGVARLVPAGVPYVTGWVGMIGIVMVLHFGVFHLLSCAWRSVGVGARPLMDRPLVSSSLGEFWGRRWNTAFRDLTHRFCFRPLSAGWGVPAAVLTVFAISGLIHDVVISVPAGGGHGGPSLFFVLQGAGLLIERSGAGRRLGLGSGWRGWLFTMGFLIAPIGVLFHPPFVADIIVPFMRAVGAL